MFAYCNCNPANRVDTTGHQSVDSRYSFSFDERSLVICGSVVLVGYVVVTAPSMAEALNDLWQKAKKATYDFAKTLVDVAESMYADHQPRVHHVIPQGEWTGYRPETTARVAELQEMLAFAGISIDDPENLIIVSHGAHKHMHTDSYIESIYFIMQPAIGRGETDVRAMLFWARLFAASYDQY